MTEPQTSLDLASLAESHDLECKVAHRSDGLLTTQGAGRGMVYFLPWQAATPSMVFQVVADAEALPELGRKTPELEGKTPELGAYLDWQTIPANLQAKLRAIASPIASRGKVSTTMLREAILALCDGKYLGLRVLAHALERDSDDLRKRTLMPMVKEGVLRSAYPSARDPRQAYTANTTKLDS